MINRRRAIHRLLAATPIAWSLPGAAASESGLELRVDTSVAPINSATFGDFAIYSVPPKRKIKTLLLTTAKRDVLGDLTPGLDIVVPKSEAHYFSKPEAFWDLFQETRFHDYDARQSKWPSYAFQGAKITPVAEGDHVGTNLFTVVDTPGFTRGSISYLTIINGRKYAFTGDLIMGDGQVADLYSLQDGITDVSTSTRVAGRNTVRGYHGFAARASDLMASLIRIRDAKPDVIVPARGAVINNPQHAIDRLLGRLQAYLREHFSTDALRWYWGDDNLKRRAAKMSINDLAWMDMAETRKLPDWMIPIQNSKLIISKTGGAYLVDCGYERVYDEVEKLRQQGRFRKLEGIYVTHYHDDHTDFVAEAARRANVPVSFVSQIRDVLEKPQAYRLPAMTRNAILKGEPMSEGSKKRWHEYEMEFGYFPGQTLYHGVMVLTHADSGTRIVLGGDSFTPSGIDDYCLLNRNFTGETEGYLYCLRYLRKLGEGAFLTNQHVDPMWTYTSAQFARIETSLRKRTAILKDLFPWDSPNYGIDEQWARFYPYGVEAKPGSTVDLEVRVTNHSPAARAFRVRPLLPVGWKLTGSKPDVRIEPGADGSTHFSIQIPVGAKEGLSIITADVESGPLMKFPAFVESMVRIKA
jgi:glyoxylase-like metal-dependent hydrolase (beta-lactamase superfamily II)